MDSLILVMGAIAVVVLHIIAGILHRQQNRIQQRFALLEERLAGLESVTRPPTSPISNKVSGDTSLDRPAVAEVLKIPLTTPADLGLDRSIITTTPNRNTVILPLAASHSSHAPFVPFGTWSGTVPSGKAQGHESLFLGVVTDCKNYFTMKCVGPGGQNVQFAHYPEFGDHTFQWHTIIHTLEAATTQFNYVELGGGWAKWSVDASALRRRLRPGLPGLMLAVEAQPGHCDMARKHIRENNASDVDLVCGAVAEMDGEVEFVDNSGNFGAGLQALRDGKDRDARKIKVKAFGLCGLLSRRGFKGLPIDIVDLDIQGFELAVLGSAKTFDCVTQNVRVLHIGMHRVEANDARVFQAELVKKRGWVLTAYFPITSSGMRTRFGPTSFADGVMTLVNPALSPELATTLYHRDNIYQGSYAGGNTRAQLDWSGSELRQLQGGV